MVDTGRIAGRQQAQLPAWKFIGGQTESAPSGFQLTIPSTATIIEIATEDEKCYWSVGIVASVLSPGYIPADGVEILGPLSDHTLAAGVWVHGTGVCHVSYWREV